MTDSRIDGRCHAETRPVEIQTDFMPNADGSALIKVGETRVICAATLNPTVPHWMRGQGRGWVNAEYGMLPNSTGERIDRRRAATSGRTKEIERLIGRSLRSVMDMEMLGERTVTVDCDVLRADGGTRTAAITGGFVAVALALQHIGDRLTSRNSPLLNSVSAVSVGIVEGAAMLDLNYLEDSRAEVDMNVVMTGEGYFVEVQGTAEGIPFTDSQLQRMLDLAQQGCNTMMEAQQRAIEGAQR